MRRPWFLALAALAAPTAAPAADVAIAKTSDSIEFKADGQVVARYHVGAAVAKPFLWPVLAPDSTPVTRTWPIEKGAPGDATTDHPHQKSAWFCHGDVIPEGLDLKIKTKEKGGKGVDFWSESKDPDGTPRHGKIVCVKVGEPKQHDKNYASVATWNEWRTPDGVKILDEERTIHFRDLPAGRLFAFECKLTASVGPVAFGDTKEGSFGVRVHDAMRTAAGPAGGAVTAAGGNSATAPAKDNLPVWGQVADWNDYSGTVDGKAVGIAVFDHPSNPARAAWHTRAYGLMAANPFGRAGSGFPSQKGKTELFRIEQGKDVTFRYGIYAHRGDVTEGKVAAAYEDFKK